MAMVLLLVGCVLATKAYGDTKASPTLVTTPSASSAVVGDTVFQTATLSGANSPTGRMVYYYYQNGNCSGQGEQIGNATVAGNGNAINSYSVTFSSPGSYSFQAVYSGDANNNPATSACVLVTVVQASSTTVATSTSTSTASASSSSSSSSEGSLPLDLALVVAAVLVILVLAIFLRRGSRK